MPRKQGNKTYSKPQIGYVHPSLAASSLASTPSNQNQAPASVSERINHLRRTQGPRIAADDPAAFAPQFELRIGLRRPAGPEPRSWSASRVLGTSISQHGRKRTFLGNSKTLEELPGIAPPSKRSLLHLTLKELATNFDFHCEYDHVFLSSLPVEIKSTLLSYISTFGSPYLLDLANLKLLFGQDSRVPGATANDELERLDLAGSIGQNLTLKQLRSYWTTQEAKPETLPDSWETESLRRGPSLRFPALTRLSLARPSASISWSELLTFSRHLSRLTHLSLACWPIPTLPSAAPASITSRTQHAADDAWEEAAAVLKQLSRNTSSLAWLSLEGCGPWFRTLRPSPTTSSSTSIRQLRRSIAGRNQPNFDDFTSPTSPNSFSITGPEWCGGWRHLSYVNLSQGWLPQSLTPLDLHDLIEYRTDGAHAELEDDVRRLDLQESYRVVTPSESMQDRVESPYRRQEWWVWEREALRVAALVRAVRKGAGAGWCAFDHGWELEDVQTRSESEM